MINLFHHLEKGTSPPVKKLLDRFDMAHEPLVAPGYFFERKHTGRINPDALIQRAHQQIALVWNEDPLDYDGVIVADHEKYHWTTNPGSGPINPEQNYIEHRKTVDVLRTAFPEAQVGLWATPKLSAPQHRDFDRLGAMCQVAIPSGYLFNRPGEPEPTNQAFQAVTDRILYAKTFLVPVHVYVRPYFRIGREQTPMTKAAFTTLIRLIASHDINAITMWHGRDEPETNSLLEVLLPIMWAETRVAFGSAMGDEDTLDEDAP